MLHQSVKLNTPCEFINITQINPLISKCQIKVCYVGENRNKSVISKEVAAELAQSLPGSPIVGYFNEETQDFGEHEREIAIENNKLVLKDITKPYGFVDVNAKCWFQWFLDDNSVEREYLVTEGYIWTGQYPESQRIIDQGNNHSMELDQTKTKGSWTKDENGNLKFFIINESIISKLCVLGINEEPCFEGSTIKSVQFSLEEDFKAELFTMMNKIQELLEKGGSKTVYNLYAVTVGDSLWTALYGYLDQNEDKYSIKAILEEGETTFAVLSKEDSLYRANFTFENEELVVAELEEFSAEDLPSESQFSLEDIETFITKYNEDKEKEEKKVCPKCGKPIDECTCDEDEDDKDKFSLKDYEELMAKHSELQNNFSDLETRYSNLESELESLKTFKLEAERKEKQSMIDNTFYMLSDEDKKDVIENIDTYSLDEIEGKLSVICVRNKVSFALEDDDEEKDKKEFTFGLEGGQEPEAMPAWVKAVKETAKTL